MKQQCDKANSLAKTKLKFFSEYGYIEVDKEEYEDKSRQQVNFTRQINKLEGTISRSTLCEHITVNLKTLYGSRQTFSFEVGVNDKISVLIDKLIIAEFKLNDKVKWNASYQYRIISTNGVIKEINPALTFVEEEIKSNYTLIIATPYKIYFSETMKHQGIFVRKVILFFICW